MDGPIHLQVGPSSNQKPRNFTSATPVITTRLPARSPPPQTYLQCPLPIPRSPFARCCPPVSPGCCCCCKSLRRSREPPQLCSRRHRGRQAGPQPRSAYPSARISNA
jgi:hypothetical protein